VISIGIVSEYRSSFDTPHHNVMQGIGSVDSGSPWHATPLPFPTFAEKFYNLTASPLSDMVSIGGGFSFGETTGYCQDCKAFVNIRWKPTFPPTQVGHVFDDLLGENIPLYACPKCGSPFREIKFPEDLIHCPRCGMESIEKWGIFLYD
jgi:hypothetical protein